MSPFKMEVEIPWGTLKEELAPLLNALLFYPGRVKERLRLSYQKSRG